MGVRSATCGSARPACLPTCLPVSRSDVMQNQGPAANTPLSQPCCCTPRTATPWPVHFSSPSRNGGESGKR